MLRNLKSFFSHPSSLALGVAFATVSVMLGSWVTRIPEVKNDLQLSEGTLGWALLGMALGGLIIMPVTPWIMEKFSTGRTTVVSSIFCCFTAILPVLAFNFWTLFIALMFFGIATGVLDVAMNAAAAAVEKRDNIAIMSTCHGMFSLGGTIGAGVGSLLVGWDVFRVWHLLIMGGIMLGLNLLVLPILDKLPDSPHDGEHFAIPKKPLLGLAIIGFCIMIGEGAVADWSSVFLEDILQSSAFYLGLGFAGFNFTMTLGRFFGDSITPKLGEKKVVQWGSFIGAVGILTAALSEQVLTAILGFTLVGLGFSVVVPILFRAAANVKGIPSGIGVASVTTTGILGFLIGPPLIGFIAEDFGLRIGLGVVGGLALLSFFVAQRVKI